MKNNYPYKIHFNLIKDANFVLEKYINDSLFKIVWLKRNCIDIPTAQYCDNIRELKRKYHGQTYMFYPIKIINNSIKIINEETDNNIDGIVIVSKRDIRNDNHILKYDKIKNIKLYADSEIKKFVNFINYFLSSKPICCSCNIVDENNNIIDEINGVVALTERELKLSIIGNTKIVDESFDDFIRESDFSFLFRQDE